jgi:hypothetical protein
MVAMTTHTFEAPTQEDLAGALGELQAVLDTFERGQPDQLRGSGFTAYNPRLAAGTPLTNARAMVRNPIAYYLRRSIRSWGKTVVELYGMRGLRSIVGSMERYDQRVDEALHGISDGGDVWGA